MVRTERVAPLLAENAVQLQEGVPGAVRREVAEAERDSQQRPQVEREGGSNSVAEGVPVVCTRAAAWKAGPPRSLRRFPISGALAARRAKARE